MNEDAATDVVATPEKVDRGETVVSAITFEAGQHLGDRVWELLLNKLQIEPLTPTERRIHELIGEDLISKEIASCLNPGVRTVANHRQHACNKLKLHGTHSLLQFAFDNCEYL